MAKSKIIIPIVILVFLGALVALAIYFKLFQKIGFGSGKAELVVNSSYGQLTVLLNDSLVGKTPYEGKELNSGEYTLAIKSDLGVYENKIQLTPYTQTYVTRDIGPSPEFSSGSVVWMEAFSSKSTTISVISNPSEALVKIDSIDKGKTPLILDDVTEGTHTLEVIKDGYDSQSIFLKVKKGFKINVNSDLFLKPLPANLEGFDYSSNIKIYSVNLPLTVGYDAWAKGIAYYEKTRGKMVTYDFILDEEGSIYDKNGIKTETAPNEAVPEAKTLLNILYLSKGGEKISGQAENTLAKFFSAQPVFVKVIPTGVGFLRVRAEPSLDAAEIARINVGEQFLVTSEVYGWIKIKLADGKEGWSSSAYLEKVVQ